MLGREGRFERPPDDHGEEVGVRDVRDGVGSPDLSVAQDGDTIGDLPNLAEAVRDVDDGRSLCRKLSDGGEEEVDGILGERRRRLVEDEKPRRHGERLGELEEVAAGDAERRDAIVEVALEMDVVEERAHRPRAIGVASSKMLGGDRHTDVLGDGHVREEGRMLVDDRDPELLRDHGREVLHRRALEDDRAAVGRRRARGDVHQRRLPGAVLPEESVHLAREHVERHIRERRDRVVVLGDAVHRQRRMPRAHGHRDGEGGGRFVDHGDESRSRGLCAAIADRRARPPRRSYPFTSLACTAAGNSAER